jgi:hypothetical protein
VESLVEKRLGGKREEERVVEKQVKYKENRMEEKELE